MPITIGQLNFGVINISPQDVGTAFQEFIRVGSSITGVPLDSLDMTTTRDFTPGSDIGLSDLLSAGVKLFDAVVWLSAGKPSSHWPTMSDTKKVDDVVSHHQTAKAVFYCYFFLLTQARYPAMRGTTNQPATPNFLSGIMGLAEPQHIYVERVCSFNINLFDPRWIRYVSFAGLGQEAISRFGLGVAGYRLFGPFKNYEPKVDIPQNLLDAYRFAKEVSKKPPTWDIHPITRSPEILTTRGNLNKNLGNLILDVFTEGQIQEMVNCKMLYAVPKREPTCLAYKQWAAADDISGNALIFR